jgi:hypothetical protein
VIPAEVAGAETDNPQQMDVDLILSTFNRRQAEYILIGGMNFFIVHEPVVTFDVDLWVADMESNHRAVHAALVELQAEVSFSPKGEDWRRLLAEEPPAWLTRQSVHCVVSPHGPVDVFRHVPGLEAGYAALREQCPMRQTPSGVPFRSLNDELMIRCQLALPANQRKLDRLRALGYEIR